MRHSSPIIAVGELLWDLLPTGKRAGGAPFNFAFHCQQLGHPAVIVSRVGDDVLGTALRAEVRRLGMADDYIQTDALHATGTVDVVLDATGQPTYTIQQPMAWDHLTWYDDLATLAGNAVAVCYGTLAQRNATTRTTLQRFLQSLPANTLRVCDINLRPTAHDPDVWRDAIAGCHWLKLNHDELEPLTTALGVPGDVAMLAPHASLICLTRGANGALLEQQGDRIEVPGRAVQVVDTVGAGDAFTAALLVRTLQGDPPATALAFANAYAALVASRAGGTPTISAAEIAGCG